MKRREFVTLLGGAAIACAFPARAQPYKLPIIGLLGASHWVGWWIKVTGLPLMYWNYMLKGHVWFPKHNTSFKGDVV